MTKKLNITGDFYQTYKKEKPDFDKETFECAEETIQKLRETATGSEHPGMLLGKVQSGKTRAFITILALAFDNDFDIAIVLSKNSKALIDQTTKRLNSEFETFVDANKVRIDDIMAAPPSYSKYELKNKKFIFVAKKQKDNLKKLITMISKTCPDMLEKRILIIDDEADNASVGYSKNKNTGEIDANTIAKQISDLRSHPDNISFLQVTATPYSLYLQPKSVVVGNSPEFKPTKPAFTVLVPVPKAYVGGDTYFGEQAKSEVLTVESLIHYTVEHEELVRLKKEDRRSVKKGEELTTGTIEGFRTAIVNLIVGGSIQRINGLAAKRNPNELHYSLLLHSEQGKASHAWQHKLTKEIIAQFKQACEKNTKQFQELVNDSYKDLKRSLKINGDPVPTLKQVLTAVAEAFEDEHLTVATVNSDNDVANMLDSSGQLELRTPLNIFIGGQVLDRGITLANLIGFYYGRRPGTMQQDTVLQHSRMYGYRRDYLAVTRFYTSTAIRSSMFQMEEFDSTLRAAIEAGGDRAVQFIRKSATGKIIPCSPNKILRSTTQTLKPHKRILPFGFQSGYKTGKYGIANTIESLDSEIEGLCGFGAKEPVLISLEDAIDFIDQIEPTLEVMDETPPFDWDSMRAALTHLSSLHSDPDERGWVLLWAANNRNSARYSGEGSHSTFIETPDSPKTEGKIAKKHAIDYPMLFLLRQNGSEDKGWRDTPFYWPVVRAQANTPMAIYSAETQ